MATRPVPLSSSLQTFGDISRWLRESVADEDSQQFREAVTALSAQVEAAVRIRRAPQVDPRAVLECAGRLLDEARAHQLFLSGLGSAWHALYEFGAYESALRQLIRATAAWQEALQRRSRDEAQRFHAFEGDAWRALGEAVLAIDLYQQGGVGPSEMQDLLASSPMSPPAQGWWSRLGAWLGRPRGRRR
ncbi:hypothetical protein QRO11_19600 [Paracidovorax citrulli]|uniref:hypothetical protein n=1 Tax=Paracidovorax citrulli TaxID=80869 RepID=UPI000888453B|nr:hypothetical protein [Paracidovorax citrulli]UMT87031.1 hypothetical protein FRC90_02485 [Paracidovorax citrulli]WIY34122.1 hypothetical protein QRO11_19600 [Paracidovorax citrulli]SDJ19206.1 hypothetical protein SAMN04489709_102103 [Paracidovorax citrulli]